MHRMRIHLWLALIPILCSGCFTVHTHARYGRDIKLLSPEDPVTVTRTYRAWFALWGLVPLHDKEPDEIIAHERLTEVRVTVKDVIPDAIIGLIHTVALGNIGILAQTIVIEGNRAPEDSPEPARRLDR